MKWVGALLGKCTALTKLIIWVFQLFIPPSSFDMKSFRACFGKKSTTRHLVKSIDGEVVAHAWKAKDGKLLTWTAPGNL